jgi:transglutaminase-like putative cysteine protease/Flp pilus assembly protein TadD
VSFSTATSDSVRQQILPKFGALAARAASRLRFTLAERPAQELPSPFYSHCYFEAQLSLACRQVSIFQSVLLSLVCITSFASDTPTPWAVPHFTINAKVLYAEASEPASPEGTNVVVLDDEESYSFDASSRSLYTEYTVYKVLSQQGVEGWSTISVTWEPWHQERPLIRIRIITPDLVVHDLDLKTLTDAPAQDEQSNIYSDRRVIRGPLPAVAPGSVVEQEIVVRESTPYFSAGALGRYFFGRVSVPVHHSRLAIETPSAVPLHYVAELLPELQPQKTESDGRARIVFERGAMDPLVTADSNLPSDVPAYPFITFSTGTSWERVAEDYATVVDGQIKNSDVKAVVEKLTLGKQTQFERIQAISGYLDKQIRYTGVEFGEAAIVPHSPTETLVRKYGDCKDKSTLLVAMLRAAGIPAYIALLNAGARMDVPAELPGMSLFDHAIVYVPVNPELWIDATDEFARPGQLPTADQGRLALVVRPETTSLVRTPEAVSQDNLLAESREVHLSEYGPARIVERTQPHGASESFYRRSYADKQNKTTQDNLTSYVKSQYLAERLDKLDRSDPDDLSHQFELVLETDRAKGGFSDLKIAVNAIRLEGLFYRLPVELRKRQKNDTDTNAQNSKARRTADYQLPEAFATEWHYTITPPAGFRPKPLPKDIEFRLGPSILTENFSADTDNTVHANLRFDTMKRRLNVEEAAELRERITQLVEGQPILVYFEPVGEVLADEGKIRDALQSYRELITAHPKEAVLHLRLAKALLAAGLAEGARAEARTATQLDPNSALAQKTLAEILEYDVVGRKFRLGSDYAGAEAAFRAAEKLDPEDKATVANLAILLEYDHWGLRYGSGAKLRDAVAEYKKLTAEQRTDLGIQNNLPFALFYASDFSEAEKAAQASNAQPIALIVACEAILNGKEAGMAEARKRTPGDEQFRQVARNAGEMLENLRKYSLAADFIEAGAAGVDASVQQSYASLMRRTQLHEQIQPSDDPAGAAIRYVLLELDPDLTVDQLRSISSRNGATTLAIADVRDYLTKTFRAVISEKSRKEDFWVNGHDFTITRAQPSVQGSDAMGYKVTLWPTADYKRSVYLVKEDGHYKVLATTRFSAGIGLEVLDRLAANDQAGARVLLDWLREEEHLAGGDDPLATIPFPHFWTKGKDSDTAEMRLAAAAILVMTDATAERGISILEAANGSVSGDIDKTNLALALVYGYDQLHQYEKGVAPAATLQEQYPESDSAFRWHCLFLRESGRSGEADVLAQERLRRTPGDLEALRGMAADAISREDFAKAHDIAQGIVKDGKGSTSELAGIPWYSLFTGKPLASDVEAALKAAELSNNAWSILHTLGCLYAELGKLKEAREVLVQAMDSANLDNPDSDFWYAFGRVAEQAGERDLALADYARVTIPKDPSELVESSYRLAQIRLKALQKAAK